jgi:hypothetical protein
MAEERGQPALARGQAPHLDRDIGADEEAAGVVCGMEASTHVLKRRAVGGQHVRREIDVAKGDRACLHRLDELVALASDAGAADRATRVVPDHEAWLRHPPSFAPGQVGDSERIIPLAAASSPPFSLA